MESAASSVTQASTSVTGGGSPKAHFFDHLPAHPLSDAYHTQAPIRVGDDAAKLGAFPDITEMTALENESSTSAQPA